MNGWRERQTSKEISILGTDLRELEPGILIVHLIPSH